MKSAVNEVLEGIPLNFVVCEFIIDQTTLKTYCHKKKLNLNESFKLTTTINKLLAQIMKKVYLVIYYLHQKWFFSKSTRLLAYEFAKKKIIKIIIMGQKLLLKNSYYK